MILHIVCLRFASGTTAGQIAAAGKALLGLAGQIPEIREMHWGRNVGPSAADYSHVLTVSASDMEAVGRYLDHPLHVDVVARYLAPIREARLAIDVEM